MVNRVFVLVWVIVCVLAIGGCKGSGDDDGDSGGHASHQTAAAGDDPSNKADDAPEKEDASKDENSKDGAPEEDAPEDGASENAVTGSSDPLAGGKASPADDPPGKLGDAARRITDVSVQRYGKSDSATIGITFGQVFAAGDVGADQTIVAAADGQALPTQLDRKATWSDGSLRHGVVTVQLAASAGGRARTLGLYAVAGKADSGTGRVSLNDLLSTDFHAEVALTIDGTTYRANARDALDRAARGGGACPAWGESNCKRWLAGSLASEWVVSATPTHGNDSAPGLRVFFNVRAERGVDDRIANVRVDTVIENDQAYGTPRTNETYDAEIVVGKAHYTASDITHYTQARWHHVLWSNGEPGVYVQPDVAYLQRSRAISRYAEVSPSAGYLDGMPQSARPMDHVEQTPDMERPGAQSAIGPLPRWTSAFVVSGDHRAFHSMLANDDGAGSYSFHYRDGATGRPLRITDHPYATIAAIGYARTAGDQYQKDLLPSCHDCKNPYTFNIAHQPSIGYVSYLVTGDFYYLEEMQFEASYDELWANPRYRRYDKGRLLVASPQVRGQAWQLRSISDAAFATPDDDPMKPYFVDQIDYIIQDYIDSYVDDPGHPLHTLDSYGAVHYPAGSSNTEISSWQADFFIWAVGHAADQAVPGAKRLLDWLAPFQIGLMVTSGKDGTEGFCWLKASGYAFKVRDSNDSPIYDTLAEVYRNTYPRLAGLACDSREMRNVLASDGKSHHRGEMSGYPKSPTGFPSNFQIGLAAAVDSQADGGKQAWKLFAERPIQPDYSNYANFALVPRSWQ